MDTSPIQPEMQASSKQEIPLLEIDDLPPAVVDVSRRNILDFGDEGFLLDSVLSNAECDHFIEKGKLIGFDKIPGMKDEHRSSLRVMFRSPGLAKLLWDRIKHEVKDIEINGDPALQHVFGPLKIMRGKWTPVGLNEQFRVCSYDTGGHFAPHFDGVFVENTRRRSLMTLMLYLNSDFEGGSTNFMNSEVQDLHKNCLSGKYCGNERNVLIRIKPETGMATVFNHHRLHEGEQLKSGEKYILRTDIMFQKEQGEEVVDEAYEKAMKLISMAEQLEADGEVMEAAEMYRKAFKIHADTEQYYNHNH
ncbi:uncharacterized protein LOC141900911 [Tubulanus polymorphus]|uniref:uncharacterized protein LOC141900911 n=1 Tax=Tubulanus polymorphus TaxID=672921 RepID=UPI003DA29797